MPEARELREGAVWFRAAAKNATDPRLKAPMLARARDLNRRAKALAALESRARSGVDRDQGC